MQYDFEARSKAVYIFNEEPSLTKQSFKDQCDINNILKKYKKNGVNPFVITQGAAYSDLSSVPTYQEALDYVNAADDAFMALPANVRSRFVNDPMQLINFLANPENKDEAVKLGLLEKPVVSDKIIPAGKPVDLSPTSTST